MAQIRTVVPQTAVSNFRPVQVEAGGGFRLLAQGLDTAYEALKPKAIQEMTEKGDALGREMAKQQIGEPAVYVPSTKGDEPSAPADPNAALGADAMAALGKTDDSALALIRSFEGFRETPYWDVNALRTGYGSDTVTLPDGTVQKVGDGTRVTRADADRDLHRRVNTEFSPIAARAVGAERWAAMTPGQKAALTSIAYNYGEIPGRITAAVQSGDPQAGAAAIAALGSDNDGINRGRREKEAAIFAGGALPSSVSVSTSGGEETSAEPYTPTILRGADGKLTSRLFGPTSNPILAAHDAAAGAAWQADVFLKSSQDFMGMSEQYAMDPDGFKQASDEYVAAMVEEAPDDFKMDVRSNLEKEAGRRFLGLIDEKQRNIRERAANSTSALADKWADDLAGAIATGSPEDVAAARSELASVLAVKERLPGSTWTPEQSANYMSKAEEAGQTAIKKAQDEQTKTFKSTLSTVTDAAKAGMHAADESILDNPLVQQLLPDEWREAVAFVTLRDQLPTFNMMPPAQQAAALAEMKAQPVQEEWEVDLYGAAEKAAGDNAKAWVDDPIKRAGEVLTDEPPPPLPELDPENPEAFMSALTARADYAQKLMDEGYTKREVYLSKDEAKMIGGIFGKDVPPELKALAAGAVVGAMGDDAAGFFKQINTTDPVLPHVGALMARGGDATVAVEAMTGQALLDQKVVPAPTAKAVAQGRAKIEGALKSAPGAIGAMDGISKTATAIYASRVPANADDETQASIMEEAWQAALGQSNSLGRTTGGVQEIGGQQVLLPPTVAGEDLEGAMKAAFGDEGGFWSWAPKVDGRTDLWIAAAGGLPSLGGEPISPELWRNGELTMTPVGGSRYMLSVNRNGVMIDIGVEGQGDDVPFIFDAEALIAASLVPQ